MYLVGEFDLDWDLSHDALREWWHDDGMASAQFIDFTGKWHTFVEFHHDPGEQPDLAKMQAVLRERTGHPDVRLSNPDWIGKLVINQRMPDHFKCGRALLAGDAAHVHSGAGGQGMNTGMQDAINLGWKLALAMSGAAAPDLLQTYESERLPNARNVLRATQSYQHIQAPRGAFWRWLGGSIFEAIQALAPIGDAAFERLGMLDVNYHSGPLSRESSAHVPRHSRAGWRLPDAPCRLAGRPSRLFEVIRGTKAHLLLFTGQTPDSEILLKLRSIGENLTPLSKHLRILYVLASEAHAFQSGLPQADVLIDGGEQVQLALGLSNPEMIYIRPDGYIGLRTEDIRREALLDYLAAIYSDAQLQQGQQAVDARALANQPAFT